MQSQDLKNQRNIITLGGGCFWCIEAVFQQLRGVEKVISGYMGGRIPNPTYDDVCSGLSGHAEVARIIFDPAQISLQLLLEVFWTVHDPTTLNRQGNDVGTQYRSVIFYENEGQKEIALDSIKTVASHLWEQQIVTEIEMASEFYVAEDYHQDFYLENPNYGYCQVIINPKLTKFRTKFADYLI